MLLALTILVDWSGFGFDYCYGCVWFVLGLVCFWGVLYFFDVWFMLWFGCLMLVVAVSLLF